MRWLVDRCTNIENCQGGTERSLGEELASPKTPSRILPVLSTAILENGWASMYIGQNRGNLKFLHAANELLRVIKCRRGAKRSKIWPGLTPAPVLR